MVKCRLAEILLAVAVRRSFNAVDVVCSLSLMELALPYINLDMTVAKLRYHQGLRITQCAFMCFVYD